MEDLIKGRCEDCKYFAKDSYGYWCMYSDVTQDEMDEIFNGFGDATNCGGYDRRTHDEELCN